MKVFAIDLDGTLLDENKVISEHDAKILIDIQERGNRIVLATGRNNSEAQPYIDELKLQLYRGAVILADGQYTVDYNKNESYESAFLQPKDIIYLLNLVTKDTSIEVITPFKNYYIFNECNKAFWRFKIRNTFSNNMAVSKKRAKKIEWNRVEKVVTNNINDDIHRAFITKNYEMFYVQEKRRYEIKQKDVDKAKSLSMLLDRWEVSKEDLYVFGNDENDISMMNLTQNSYAVFNSTETIKNIANHILYDTQSAVVECITKIIKK